MTVARAVSLAFLTVLVLSVPRVAADRRASTLPSPGIRSNPGWLTVTPGATNPAQPPQVFALTANDDALTPLGVFDDLKKLGAGAAFIWVMTISKTGHPFTFKHAVWPPRLQNFRVDRGWEGQPLPRIQQRLLWLAAGGWNLDVRVYFGTQQPSKSLLSVVQAELGRLTLPSS